MKKGFTLLELIVVIIIVGILGTLGFTQYTKVIEKGRTAEAKEILGQLSKAQSAYQLERATYANTLNDLYVNAPMGCTSSHYFTYNSTSLTGTATRCTSSGKSPQGTTAYIINLTYNTGEWAGSPGYY